MSVEIHQVEPSTQAPVPEEKTQDAPASADALPVPPVLGSPEARERLYQAEAIIRGNTLWSAGAGTFVILFPYMDVVAAAAVQLKMLKNLSDLYGVKFSEGIAAKIVSTLVMGSGGALVGDAVMRIVNFIPGVGRALSAVSAPLMAAAFTHALGHVYVVHLESGGALLDFDPKAMQERFKEQYEKSKEAVRELRKEVVESATQHFRPPSA
ncbi:YcjF family protein [Melittangium boletus]|uniref:GTPase n=1 Tax=Melittangium boletus DSM 14713 TaxID=1294270 RepID=A0A250IPS2_9BACT|nr:DUF697 domain-containing protein [Melittangium boletus]ATB33171.1 hypothetical protein MEBOL_006660 [Melittangium boletus DSM 14713]